MPIVGTAGHVDHGKSTLVQALTGRDPDRWQEEKDRGLTIDLGFAWTSLEDGTEVGFVDVPGHERFIKNMLAGVGAFDVALLVVAADEGWMPQTEEHMSVLDLLDIEHGVIAMTRRDLVDEDLAELAALEISERVAATTLADWPIVEVAAPTGRGLDEVRRALTAALRAAGPARDTGRPRLWVDRAFSIAGSGLVVTGTLVDGSVRVDDVLEAFPGRHTGRVRSLHRHDRPVDVAVAGSRTAINLAGVDRSRMARGSLLVAPGTMRESTRMLADVRTVRALEDPLGDRGAYRLHLGTRSTTVRLRVLAPAGPSETGTVLITADTPVPVEMGDRFVLHDVGRRAVVAGGRILDPAPPTRRRDALAAVPSLRRVVDSDADARAESLLALRGAARAEDLAADTGGGRPASAIEAGDEVISPDVAERLVERMLEAVAEYHRANPLRPGIPKATLASLLEVSGALIEAAIALSDGRLVTDATAVRLKGFAESLDAAQTTAWNDARRVLVSSGFAVPRASELGLDQELIHALIRDGKLVRVADDLLYLPEQIDGILGELDSLSGGFTVAQFRDALSVTRRHAVPLLEWLDAAGRTTRRGDVRVVKRRSSPDAGVSPPR